MSLNKKSATHLNLIVLESNTLLELAKQIHSYLEIATDLSQEQFEFWNLRIQNIYTTARGLIAIGNDVFNQESQSDIILNSPQNNIIH